MNEFPEFDIFTDELSLVVKDDNGSKRRYFNTIASSTVEDSHGDRFTESAVEKMARTANEAPMTIFLNHEYRVPEDVFGTTTSARTTIRSDNGELVTDLDIAGMVNEANPRARQTADLIENGARLGVSIGARVKNYRLKDEKDPRGGWIIDDVELKEASIVGLPANPRTWVQYATKAIRRFERERVKEAIDMENTAAEMAQRAVDTTITEDGDETIDLIDQAAETDTAKVFTTENIPGAPAQAVDGADQSGMPTFEGPDEDAPAEADAQDEESAPEQESPATVSASETPTETPSQKISGAVEELSLAALSQALKLAKDELTSKDAEIVQLTQELDVALEALATATSIVDSIASKPLGRKATFAKEVDDYRTRISGVYDEEFRKFLKGPHAQ